MEINNFDFYKGLSTLKTNDDTGFLEGVVSILASHINKDQKEIFWINADLNVAVNQDFIYPARVYEMDIVSSKTGGAYSDYILEEEGLLFHHEDMANIRSALSVAIDKEAQRRIDRCVYADNAGFKDDTENMQVSGKIFAYIDNAGDVDGDVYGLSINNDITAHYNARGFVEIWKMDICEARRVFHDSDRKDEVVSYEWVGEERSAAVFQIKRAVMAFIEDNDNVLRVEDDEKKYEYLMWELTDSQFDMKRWSNAWSNEEDKKRGTALLTLVRERLRIEVLNNTKSKKDVDDYIEVKCIIGYGDIVLDEITVFAEDTLKSINQAIESGISRLDFGIEDCMQVPWH